MGYLLGYMYEQGYRVWIPKLGVREARDVTFYEDTAPIAPGTDAIDHIESRDVISCMADVRSTT